MAPELREQLQAHLGSAYTIERELGGGGMSRVFLAQEVRLERTVVVKVLPPQMAAGVSVDRFEREIHLAAKLQHPHIVPLLTAGSAGDLLYYIMPHIEGESLRARLAHDHELPVPETVRILRDVADALAYAHAHGIVHRDVKPDNVLLSGKHALVTDFGVAKAVAESTGKTALTSLGVALGTPAYMAPEQAAADPNTDHRADLYAVGALAYEMLTGRPPFTGSSPQAVLAAQVSQSPEPIAKQRASVPPALGALVMRCLEKKPADRLQTAEELLVQLEAMATPSGGVIPTGAVPTISSGTEAAIQRAHPIRVAVLYTAASIGVLTTVYWLIRGLGLPDWVFPAAVGLLLAGLPIMVVTGLVERRRAIARSAGRFDSRAAAGLRRWLTWRKAFVGGAAAFAALGLGTAVYMAMRVLGIGPVGTLVASGVLSKQDVLIVADFDNRTGDSTLGASVTEALRIDLAQSPVVKLMEGSAVAGVLRRMQRDPAMRIDAGLAQEIAERGGAKAVVAGEIAPLGRGYVLSARLVSTADSATLVARRETAADDRALIPAVDRLSRQLRERIGESLKSIRGNEPLEQVTTRSLEALRKYSAAQRAADRSEWSQAAGLLEEAIGLDSGFAMAWRKLAVVVGNAGGQRAREVFATTKAYEYRDRLPTRERLQTIAYYYLNVDYQPDKVIDAYRAVLETYPSDPTALNNLAVQFNQLRRYSEAEQLALRALATGESDVYYDNALQAQVAQGKFAAAETTLARDARRAPNHPPMLVHGALLASARGDYALAEALLDSLVRSQSGSPFWQMWGHWYRSNIDRVRGKLASAEQQERAVMSATEQLGLLGFYVGGAGILARQHLFFRGASAEAMRTLDQALRRHPLESIPAPDRPYLWLAQIYADAGRLDLARRMVGEYEAQVPEVLRRGNPMGHAAAGVIALAEGRPRDAVAAFHAFRDKDGCELCYLYELAHAFERAHEPDSALAAYEQAANSPAEGRVVQTSFVLAATYKRLGEVFEDSGNRAKALEYYGRFVDLWKDADPELQPVVRDVRARIARLAGEH